MKSIRSCYRGVTEAGSGALQEKAPLFCLVQQQIQQQQQQLSDVPPEKLPSKNRVIGQAKGEG